MLHSQIAVLLQFIIILCHSFQQKHYVCKGRLAGPRCNTNKSNNEKFQLLHKLCHLNFKPHKRLHPRREKDTTFTDENFSTVNCVCSTAYTSVTQQRTSTPSERGSFLSFPSDLHFLSCKEIFYTLHCFVLQLGLSYSFKQDSFLHWTSES